MTQHVKTRSQVYSIAPSTSVSETDQNNNQCEAPAKKIPCHNQSKTDLKGILTSTVMTPPIRKRSNDATKPRSPPHKGKVPAAKTQRRYQSKMDSGNGSKSVQSLNCEQTRSKKRVNEVATERTAKRNNFRKNQVVKQTSMPPAVGDLCYGKIKGYVEWPAVVTDVQKKFAWVKFFNASMQEQNGKCTFKYIYNLHDGLKFLNKYNKNVAFITAAKEMALSLRSNMNEGRVQELNMLFVYDEYMKLIA